MGCFFIIFHFFACVGLLAVLQFILAPYVDLRGIPPLDRPDFILPFGLVGILIFVTAVYWAVRGLRRMSMPLDDLLEASNRVAEGDYSVRVEAKGPPEIRSMMQGFNSMVERLQENDRQRRAMLADVSHELRTPITVIQGNVEGILDGLYPADEARLKSIVEETQILSRLVDDLRTLALAESGSLKLKREPADLGLLVREVVSGFESQAKEKDLRVALELDDVEAVDVDPLRIREVLRNLLTNALRYTPRQGEVKVGLAESEIGGERGVLLFVEDNGPGIEPSDLPHVFERFYKSSDSGGMGLGLSIAKYLVEAHGGRIWAESDIVPEGGAGRGTRISFTLPA
jgi:signal transduction histidine kinase